MLDSTVVNPLEIAARGGWLAGVKKMLESAPSPQSEQEADFRAQCVWSVAEHAIGEADEKSWAILAPYIGKRSRGGFCDPGEPTKGHFASGGGAICPLIHHAASQGAVFAVKTLIERGEARRRTLKTQFTQANQTPLMFAVFAGHDAIARLLAPLGETDARDGVGETAFMHAAWSPSDA